MHEMLRADDRGSFAGYAGKFCTDVDAGTQVCNVWQYRGPIDSLSSRGSARSQSDAARVAFGESCRSAGQSSLGFDDSFIS